MLGQGLVGALNSTSADRNPCSLAPKPLNLETLNPKPKTPSLKSLTHCRTTAERGTYINSSYLLPERGVENQSAPGGLGGWYG